MITDKVYKELELFLYERIMLGFQCKSYATLGDAWHHIFIVVGLGEVPKTLMAVLAFTLNEILFGISGERNRILCKPMWRPVVCWSLYRGPHSLSFSTLT